MSSEGNTDEETLTPGGYREVLKIALPLIVSMGSFTVMQFCDRVFLAQYSAACIQAALPSGVLAFTLCCGFMELSGYATTFVAQFFGARNFQGCAKASAQGVFIALMSWPLMLLLVPFGRWLIQLIDHGPVLVPLELDYFTILMVGGITLPLGVAFGSFFIGRGDTRSVMYANMAGNAVNIVLDYGLIFGAFGLPELGIRGAALATVVSGFIAPAILASRFFSRHNRKVYRTLVSFRLDKPLLKRVLKFGTPSSIHIVLEVMSFSLFILFLGRIGELELAVGNMAFSINMLAFMPLIGFGQAANTLVGRYQGAQDPVTAEKAAWSTYRLGTLYTVTVGATYFLFPAFFFGFFTGDAGDVLSMEQVLPIGRYMLMMMAVWGWLDAGNIIIAGALKGAGDTRFVMVYSILMSWLVLALGEYVLIYLLDAHILVAWGWLTLHIMLLATGYIIRFRRGTWKSIDVLGQKQPVPVPAPSVCPLPPE